MNERIKPAELSKVQESTQKIEDNFSNMMPTSEEIYDGWGGCWPGDGSGMDDLADFNQMEGNDY